MEYHLKPMGKTCAATGDALIPGRLCFSVLVDRDGELVRLDYSEEGWSGPPDGTVGQWKSFVPEPTETKNRPLDTDALMRHFEQLCEEASPARDKLRYVLSLLLLQKRRLKLDGARQEGEVEWLELSGSAGEGPFEVRDFQLSGDEIQELQQSLDEQLQAEWN